MTRHCLSFYFISILELIGLLLLRGIAYIWPRRTKSVVIGCYGGELYIDNPKYLLQYLLKNTKLRITWIGKDYVRDQLPQNDRLSFATKGSLVAFWRLLNAKTWICCQAINVDLTTLPILGRAKCIDLWHGIPIKYIGMQTPNLRKSGLKATLMGNLYQKATQNLKSWLVVANSRMIDLLCVGVPSRYGKERILPVGTPRNDFLINSSHDEDLKVMLRRKYSALLGFDVKKKMVLYLPTWRMRGDCIFAFYNQTLEIQHAWKEMLDERGAVLIEKHHWGTYLRYPTLKDSVCSIAIPAEKQRLVDVQELLLIADVLISDYSGAYIDFALLKRPVIHFAHDLEEYSNEDSGLAYNLKDVAAGPIVYDLLDLKDKVDHALKNPEFIPAKDFGQLVEYETGCAASHIARFISSY